MQTHNTTKRMIGSALADDTAIVIDTYRVTGRPISDIPRFCATTFGQVGDDAFIVASHESDTDAIAQTIDLNDGAPIENPCRGISDALVAAAEATDHPADIKIDALDAFATALGETSFMKETRDGTEQVVISTERWGELNRLASNFLARKAQIDTRIRERARATRTGDREAHVERIRGIMYRDDACEPGNFVPSDLRMLVSIIDDLKDENTMLREIHGSAELGG